MAQVKPRTRERRWGQRAVADDTAEVFLEHRAQIEETAAAAGRRAGLLPQDLEDFVSTVLVKLIDDDYAVLRQHRGESALTTYLTTVVLNQLKDFCNHKWGKFRPSAKAKQLGPTALALERLLVLEQRDLDSAIETLSHAKTEASPAQLRALAAQLSRRPLRREVGTEMLENRESPEIRAERRVEDAERADLSARVESALNQALEVLNPQDLLVLKMHFRDGCTFTTIAAALHLEQRSLYWRKEKCLAELRALLAAQGLTWDEVREVLGWQGHEIRTELTAESGIENVGPSHP